MKLWLVMAQIISFTSLIAIICINYLLWRTVDSQLSDRYLQLEITYDELYQSGMQSYTNEEWEDTIFYFERALQEFHYYRKSLTDCRMKCQNLSLISASQNDSLSELKLFQAIFKKADCTRRCKLEKLGSRSERIDEGVTDKFLSMTPYSYLQFAYYKNGMYEKAVSAAYTYLQWHPEDEVMQNNLDYYRNMHGIDAEHLVNLEEKPNHRHFLNAYQAHQDSEWRTVILEMELALTEYWNADAECRALCEGKYDNREFMDLYEAISNHYASTLYCKDQCQSWLAMLHGQEVEDYLPSHFHFLQFSYYKAGNIKKAIENAASHLLFHPKDEVMLQNMAFYENTDDPGVNDFGPRPDAKAYHDRVLLEMQMLNFAKRHFWSDDPEEFLYPDKDIEEEESEVDYLGAEPINPREVNLKQTESVNIRGDYGLLADYKGGDQDGPDHDPENEIGSAKYSKDLNHEEGNHRHDDPGGPIRERFPVPLQQVNPEVHKDAAQRSQILDGIKKIVQTLMGSSEDESERLIRDLSRDPKSREIKERIRKAIEKMMMSGDIENRRSIPREQLKSMIKGLTQNDAVHDHTKEKGISENYDPKSLLQKEIKVMKHPTDGYVFSDELKDYNPMKGLDNPEYFDWVNPPGYEGNAPGSQGIQAEGVEEESNTNYAGQHHLLEEEDEELIGEREYYPSDEEEKEAENGVTNDDDDVDDDESDAAGNNEKDGDKDEDLGKIQNEMEDNEEHREEDDAGMMDEEKGEEERVLDADFKDVTVDNDGRTIQDEDESDVGEVCTTRAKCESETEKQNKYSATGNDRESDDVNDYSTKDDSRNIDKGNDHEMDGRKKDERIGNPDSKTKDVENASLNDKDSDEEIDTSKSQTKESKDSENKKGDEEENQEDEECGYCEDDDELTMKEEVHLEDEVAKLNRAMEEELDEEAKKRVEELMRIEDNAYYLLDDLVDLEVLMMDDELNGTNRVAVDGIAAEQECGILLQLLDEEAKIGNGYKGKTSPHTKYELFEGLTVKDAVDAAESGRIPLLYPTVYMHLAERSRQFLQRHFDLDTHLFFSFTHLVCREAKPDSTLRRRDLSHPVHADNCNLDQDGTCHKKLPAFVWRDWSAILYLNDNFEGGEFLFAHFNETPQAIVSPRCGRLVGFSAGSENLHGVKGVIQGRRCALAMWFTLDPRFREIEFFKAAENLNTLYEDQYASERH